MQNALVEKVLASLHTNGSVVFELPARDGLTYAELALAVLDMLKLPVTYPMNICKWEGKLTVTLHTPS